MTRRRHDATFFATVRRLSAHGAHTPWRPSPGSNRNPGESKSDEREVSQQHLLRRKDADEWALETERRIDEALFSHSKSARAGYLGALLLGCVQSFFLK
jgi:hypothetical protein